MELYFIWRRKGGRFYSSYDFVLQMTPICFGRHTSISLVRCWKTDCVLIELFSLNIHVMRTLFREGGFMLFLFELRGGESRQYIVCFNSRICSVRETQIEVSDA